MNANGMTEIFRLFTIFFTPTLITPTQTLPRQEGGLKGNIKPPNHKAGQSLIGAG